MSDRGGWDTSAAAWIADMGEDGSEPGGFGRHYVLDPLLMARARASGARTALDVGCGEGRFCRMLRAAGVTPTGIDPTPALIDEARRRDPAGDYRLGTAEALDLAGFDLVVSYLSLIDIPDIDAAIPAMARALAPGGRLLIANSNGFKTAGMGLDRAPGGGFVFDHYLAPRAEWVEWRGIRVRNYHRPLARYMQLLIGAGLVLTHFDEPAPTRDVPPALAEKAARYARAPWFVVMEWHRPVGATPSPISPTG